MIAPPPPTDAEKPKRGRTAAMALFGASLLVCAALFVHQQPNGSFARLTAAAKEKYTVPEGQPLLLYCHRYLLDVAAYKEKWTAFSTLVTAESEGVKAMFSFMDKTNPSVALQIFWFEGDSFVTHNFIPGVAEASAALWATYDDATGKPNICQVYGGYNEAIMAQAAMVPGVTYTFKPQLSGFLRSQTTPPAGAPIFEMTRRYVLEDGMDTCARAMDPINEWWFAERPGVLGGLMTADDADPTLTYDIRVLADWDAYVAHQPFDAQGNPLPIVSDLYTWFGTYDSTKLPLLGEIFAPDADAVLARSNAAAFSGYSYSDGLLGPVPDMS